mgnify:CR=1 FL=1
MYHRDIDDVPGAEDVEELPEDRDDGITSLGRS